MGSIERARVVMNHATVTKTRDTYWRLASAVNRFGNDPLHRARERAWYARFHRFLNRWLP